MNSYFDSKDPSFYAAATLTIGQSLSRNVRNEVAFYAGQYVRGHVTHPIDEMERDGIVEFAPGPNGAFRLTEAGREAYAETSGATREAGEGWTSRRMMWR